MAHDEALTRARRAVQLASEVTRNLQNALPEELHARAKSDKSPVTVADFAAQGVVAHVLGEPFVGEESADLLTEDDGLRGRVLAAVHSVFPKMTENQLVEAVRRGEASPSSAGFWTLDPVDGTKGFLRRAHYCISLARIERGEPTLGVLGCPRLGLAPGEIFGDGALIWAKKGRAPELAPLGDPEGRTTLCTPRPAPPYRVAESAEAAHSDHDLGPRLLRTAGLEAAEPVRVDSQVKYGIVARGDAQLLLRKPREGYVERIWDHAAGSLVAVSAGCVVSDLDGRALDFGVGRGLELNRGILVAPETLHGRLLEAVASLGD